MAKTNPDEVLLGTNNEHKHKEGVAGSTVTPGELVTKTGTATGGAKSEPEYSRNTTDAYAGPCSIALIDQLGGVGDALDDDYATGDHLDYRDMQTGDTFYGFVFGGANAGGAGTDLAANANISDGDLMVAYGGAGQGGTFRAVDGDAAGAVMVEAQEAVDNSAGSTPARIKLKVV